MIQFMTRELPQTRRLMIDDEEVRDLATRYGTPIRRSVRIQADQHIRSLPWTWHEGADRRAEVVFALQRSDGTIWLHSKPHYPGHVFRLPSGGILWEESVEQALFREIQEETQLSVVVQRFLGVLEYNFYDTGFDARFASYVFLLHSGSQIPNEDASDEVEEFRAVLPSQLTETSVDLHNMIGSRRGWGHWRALAHDLVYDILTTKKRI